MHIEQFFATHGRTSFPYYPKRYRGFNPVTKQYESFLIESGRQIEFCKAMEADGFRNITSE